MSKKMVLKVDVVGDGCKAQAMSSVAKLKGVKSMAVDGEKGTLTVVGDLDVVRVAKALRKAKFDAHVLSVGPEKVEEKKPDPPAKKPADEPKPPPPCCAGCSACRPHPVPAVAPFPGGVVYYEQQPEGHGCVIL